VAFVGRNEVRPTILRRIGGVPEVGRVS
jgi:hypothetical protein